MAHDCWPDADTRLYGRLIHTDSTRGEMPAELRSTVPGNGVRIIGAKALQDIGDRIVGTASGSVA